MMNFKFFFKLRNGFFLLWALGCFFKGNAHENRGVPNLSEAVGLLFVCVESDSTSSKKKTKRIDYRTVSKTVQNSRSIFMPAVLRKDLAQLGLTELGNSVSLNTYAINEALQPSTLSNMVSLNMYDKKMNIHSFSGTQSFMYKLNFTSENNVNTRRDLFGFEYRFKKAEKQGFTYSARARLEGDTDDQTYYQLGIGLQFNADSRRHLLRLEHFPVRSGPGHILELYRTQFVSYNEFRWGERIDQFTWVEANYYSDQQIDAICMTRIAYKALKSAHYSMAPLVELGYGLGTINRRDSYPYWMAQKRRLGGLGVAVAIGAESAAFRMFADATIFGEIDHAVFERYTGKLSYRIKGLATVNAAYEVYTLDNYYSNVFQIGTAYTFR